MWLLDLESITSNSNIFTKSPWTLNVVHLHCVQFADVYSLRTDLSVARVPFYIGSAKKDKHIIENKLIVNDVWQ